MAYKINFDIGGLCLFVAEPSSGPGNPARMHVVMPSMAADGNEHSMHRHVPLLVVDAKHLVNADTAFVSGLKVHIPLRHLFAEVAGVGDGADRFFCPDMADLTPVVAGHSLLPGVLGSADIVASRLVFASGGITAIDSGVCWKWYGGRVRRMAHQVRWTIEIPTNDPFELQLQQLRIEGDPLQLALKPGSNGAINLKVHHVPPGDLPPEQGTPDEPERHAQAPHFGAYFDLFDASTPAAIPLFDSMDDVPAQGGPRCTPIVDMGGSPYTCMVAGYGM